MKLSDLTPAPYNPRDITAEALSGLKASLGDFGDLSGITWNSRTGHLVCGHQRLRALQEEHGDELRMVRGSIHTPTGEQFKVREVDWSEEKERAANITANSPLISGSFTGQLEDILAGLEHDYSEMFAPLRLDEMLGELQPPVPLVDDEVPDPPKTPITKPGDLWVLGGHRVLCGDSTNGGDVDRLMEGERGHCIFTDPPYGVAYDGGMKKRRRLANDDAGTDIYRLALPLLSQSVDDEAALYLWYADGHAAAAAAAAAGYQIVAQIIWAKNHAQFVTSAHYKGKHEPCYYAHKLGKSARWLGPNNEVTLWEYDRSSSNDFHPTQKPIAVAARAITNSTAQGHIVIDGFCGGGTTIIAAEQLNRRCFGIEIDPGYCDVIVERWENLTGGKATR